MKKTIGILMVAVLSLMLFQHCQKSDFLVVTGVVRDSLTNQPIEGVYIFTDFGMAKTDQDGTFSLNGIPGGKQNINAFSFYSYNRQSKSVIITEGRINKIDFELSPIADPEIQTGSVFDIKANSAKITSSLNVKSGYVSRYGHCWSSVTSEPNLNDYESLTNEGFGIGNINFTSNLPNLQSEKIYYIRAYAITDRGPIYGKTVVFKTSEKDINSGLIAYYSFSSFADLSSEGWEYGYFDDESGNSSVLNSYNWPTVPLTKDRFGRSNNALKCEFPAYSYTYLSKYQSLNDFAISLWFKKTNWEASDYPLINIAYGSTNEIRIGEDAGPAKLYFSIQTSEGSTYKLTPTAAPSLDEWHHLVFLRNDNSLKIYMDGALQNSTSCDNSVIYADGLFFVGFDINMTTWEWKYYKGSLDDIRVYNRSLSESEISYLFKN